MNGTISSTYRYLIIGAGIAGLTAVRAIRERDPSGSILLVSEEDRVPYKRTKISKYLARGFERDDFAMESGEWYQENHIDLAVGETVLSVDPGLHRAHLPVVGEVRWEKLVFANGSLAILPPGMELGRAVAVVRTASDVERLRQAVMPMKRILVAGGGVLGVEVAEQLTALGKAVVLAGRRAHLLGTHLNEEVSGTLENLLRENGVELLLNAPVTAIDIDRSRRGEVSVATPRGTTRADMAVFCIGVRPNIGLARSAGLATGQGIQVDANLRTSHPDIYAAGDVAEHPGGFVSFLWHAAELQGQIAGANAAGDLITHDLPPFRLKCEVFGNYFFSMSPPTVSEGIKVVRGLEGSRYRALFYRDGRLCGAVMVNDKERAKSYVKAVREGWHADELDERLPLLESTSQP